MIRIEPDTRRVVIGIREELARSELTAAEVNWLVNEEIWGQSVTLPGKNPLSQPSISGHSGGQSDRIDSEFSSMNPVTASPRAKPQFVTRTIEFWAEGGLSKWMKSLHYKFSDLA